MGSDLIIIRTQGCLRGQLLGDALGAVLVEFQSPEEIQRSYPEGVLELADLLIQN